MAATPAANITPEATAYEFRIEIDLARFRSDKRRLNVGKVPKLAAGGPASKDRSRR